MNANPHHAPVTALPGIGSTSAQRLMKLHIRTVADLLWHIPFRYEDLRNVSRIADLRDGERTTIRGSIRSIVVRRTSRKHISLTEASVADTSGSIGVVWFHQPYLQRTLTPDTRVVLSGRITRNRGKLQMIAPAYEKDERGLLHVGRLVPMYPLTYGISQRQMRFWISMALRLGYSVDDLLPDPIRREENVLPLTAALQQVHFPATEKERDTGLERLKFDELFRFHLQKILESQKSSSGLGVSIPFNANATGRFVRSLPFALTLGQRVAAWDILRDMTKDVPMRRLLQGDVGSGKTVVAALAVEAALRAQTQVALMAPSQILAEQHARTFASLFSKRRVNIFLRTQGMKKRADHGALHDVSAREMDALAASGAPMCVIGTQTLLQRPLNLPALALVCVDEQHRFGVSQRQLLHHKRADGIVPHLLSMTATPIPRTLALTLASDLAVSTLKELPKGRKNITTSVVKPEQHLRAYKALEIACMSGRQAFVVAPLIDPSDMIGAASATELYEELQQRFVGKKIGLLHGGMPSKEQERILHAFAENALDVLVATPVIEVGIDIPNATVMVIEGAERFGLAQLHQLRGRVGRGTEAAICFLVSQSDSSLAQRRLAAVAKIMDGFALAKLDLELRGPGDLVGTEQSGFLGFRFSGLGDTGLIARSHAAAKRLLSQDPDLRSYPLLREELSMVQAQHHE